MIDIQVVLRNNKSWKKEFNKVFTKITKNFEKEELWNKRIEVYNPVDNCTISLLYADYYVNLIMWRPSIKLGRQFSNDMIFDCSIISTGAIKRYLDDIYIRPYRVTTDSKIMNIEMSKVIEGLKTVCEEFGLLLGISFNLYELSKLAAENAEFNDLINTNLPYGLQPIEVETYASDRNIRAMEILKKSTTGFAPMLQCGTGINPAQFQEFMVVVGNKPDIDGKVIPKPVNTNLLVGGLKTGGDYYIDAQGGNKALIMNKRQTGKAGYFSKKSSLLTMAVHISEVDKCSTKKLLEFLVDDRETFGRLEGLNFSMYPDGRGMRYVSATDINLIGKTIYIRSPLTCALTDGVCKTCYGELWRNNMGIHAGIFAATHITSRFTQNVLSVKHTNMADSEELVFPHEFDTVFKINGSQIVLNRDIDHKELRKYSIIIRKKNITEEDIEEFVDEDSSERGNLSIDEYMNMVNSLVVYEFELHNNKTMETYNISEQANGVALTLTTHMSKYLNNYDKGEDRVIVPLSAVIRDEDKEESTISLFMVEVINNELIKSLNLVKKLMENEQHLGCTTVEELLQCMSRTLIDGRIKTQLVHVAVLLRYLIRDKDDILRTPKYHKRNMQYQILTVKKALDNHPSPVVTMAFERVDEQFAKAVTFRKRNSSLLDDLFRTSIETNKGDF